MPDVPNVYAVPNNCIDCGLYVRVSPRKWRPAPVDTVIIPNDHVIEDGIEFIVTEDLTYREAVNPNEKLWDGNDLPEPVEVIDLKDRDGLDNASRMDEANEELVTIMYI